MKEQHATVFVVRDGIVEMGRADLLTCQSEVQSLIDTLFGQDMTYNDHHGTWVPVSQPTCLDGVNGLTAGGLGELQCYFPSGILKEMKAVGMADGLKYPDRFAGPCVVIVNR